MKKKLLAICLCLTIACTSIWVPSRVSAADSTSPQRLVEDDSEIKVSTEEVDLKQMLSEIDNYSVEQILSKLFQENYPIFVLEEQDAGLREAFYKRMTVEEQYKFTVLYEYAMFCSAEKNKDPNEVISLTKEQLDTEIEWIVTFASVHPEETLTQEQKKLWDESAFSLIATKYKDITYLQGEETKKVIDLASYIEYLQSTTENDIHTFNKLRDNLFVAESEEDKTLALDKFKQYLYKIYGFEEANKEDYVNTDKEELQNKEKENEKPETVTSDITEQVKTDALDEQKGAEKEEKASTAALPEVQQEKGEGIFEEVATRSIDEFPSVNVFASLFRVSSSLMGEPVEEEKYYEVYAKTSEDTVKAVEVSVSVEAEEKATYEAQEGNYNIDGKEYNWQLRVPYKELDLDGTNGFLTFSITALDSNIQALGSIKASAVAADGVYNVARGYLGSDFSILTTNTSKNQVYYVKGTVYSNDFNSQQLSNTVRGSMAFGYLSVSSYDDSRATIRVRQSGKELNGTWTMIYGDTVLNNLNIISTGNTDKTVGIVSAKNPEITTGSTKKSTITAKNCSFTNANKWGVHGDRNSYLYLENCSIANTKGGVGTHGEVSIVNSSINNAGSPYGGWAGVQLNVVTNHAGFGHAMNLINTSINGYVTGVEYGMNNYFANTPVGGSYSTFSMAATGYGNVITNCDNGILTTKYGISTPVDINLGSVFSNIYSCGTGIKVAYGSDIIRLSGGAIHNNSRGVINVGNFLLNGGSLYSNSTGENGAAIYNTGVLTIADGDIYSNSANYGGGIYNQGSLYLSGGTVRNNTANYGGGVFSTNNYTMTGGSVRNNTSRNSGGGIYHSGGTLNVQGGYIASNIAGSYGGGVQIEAGSVANFRNTTVTGNTAQLYGGGIFTNVSLPLTSNSITSNKTVTSNGGGVYINNQTLTLNGNNVDSNYAADSGGGISGWQATIIMNSGSLNGNSAATHGGGTFVNNGTFTLNGGNVNNNKAINYYGGGIFNNSGATVNLVAGTIAGNTATHGGGIFNNDGATFNIKGGTIQSNSATYGGGAFNQGGASLYMTAGTIQSNTGSSNGGAIYNTVNGSKIGIVKLTGGSIVSNISPSGSGILQNGTLQLGGTVNINSNNNITLANGHYIQIISALTGSSPITVVPNAYKNGDKIAEVAYGSKLGSLMYNKFALGSISYVVRPGDYQASGAGTTAKDITVSSKYTITYNTNTKETVTNLPASDIKYWYEAESISALTPVNGSYPFRGWSEDMKAENGEYQSGSGISTGVNRNMMLYAIWEERVQIVYAGNGADSGTQKGEIVNREDCEKNGGYLIQNNKGYTDYGKTNYGFTGWSNRIANQSNVPEYREGQKNIVNFDIIKKMAKSNQLEIQSNKPQMENKFLLASLNIFSASNKAYSAQQDMAITAENKSNIPTLTLSAVWDQVPRLNTTDKEVYEGQTVTRNDLLEGVTALDREDGILTDKIIITKIQYADGKGQIDPKQKGEVKFWENGMPETENLDTWFLQIDKNDSPVIHKVTYQVKDSAGNITDKTVNLKVKYNEYPVIEAEDRYFTLEEAQNGGITEELLLKQALEDEKTVVTDEEDDILYPKMLSENLEILNFHPNEFEAFKESGYIVLTYHIQDSMGKETYRNFTVYVIKDGVVPEVPVTKQVRFIEKKYYDLNKGINLDILSDREKEEYNSNGGLNVESKWYLDPEYAAVISASWDKDKEPEQIWKFAHEDVLKAKRYIEEHGIGNIKEEDALSRFVEFFSRCRIK